MIIAVLMMFSSSSYILKEQGNKCSLFDSKLWKSDRFGCKKVREELFRNSLRYCNLKGYTKQQVESLLGKPDFYHMLLFKSNL